MEIYVLDKIVTNFRSLTTKQIVEISHDELAWKENKDERKVISYQKYAFDLKTPGLYS
jgi:hypothetical protein